MLNQKTLPALPAAPAGANQPLLHPVLRTNDVLALTGTSRTTLARWIRAGLFPKPMKLGPRLNGWRYDQTKGHSLSLSCSRPHRSQGGGVFYVNCPVFTQKLNFLSQNQTQRCNRLNAHTPKISLAPQIKNTRTR